MQVHVFCELCFIRDFMLLPGRVTMRALMSVSLMMLFTFLVNASLMYGMDMMYSCGFLGLGEGDFHVLWWL